MNATKKLKGYMWIYTCYTDFRVTWNNLLEFLGQNKCTLNFDIDTAIKIAR